MPNQEARLRVEIADTPSKHEEGLMFRKDLPGNSGMAFVFPSPRQLSFWGQNTYLPLDIAFISPNGTIHEIEHIAPLSSRPVQSSEACTMAIEANAGWFDSMGVGPGDSVFIDRDLPTITGLAQAIFHAEPEAHATQNITKEAASSADDYAFHADIAEQDRYTTDRMECDVWLKGSRWGYTVSVLLTHTQTGLASMPAYWKYGNNEKAAAQRSFRECKSLVQDFLREYEQELYPFALVSPKIRGVFQFHDTDHRDTTFIPLVNYSTNIKRETDWRQTIYGNRYPEKPLGIP